MHYTRHDSLVIKCAAQLRSALVCCAVYCSVRHRFAVRLCVTVWCIVVQCRVARCQCTPVYCSVCVALMHSAYACVVVRVHARACGEVCWCAKWCYI